MCAFLHSSSSAAVDFLSSVQRQRAHGRPVYHVRRETVVDIQKTDVRQPADRPLRRHKVQQQQQQQQCIYIIIIIIRVVGPYKNALFLSHLEPCDIGSQHKVSIRYHCEHSILKTVLLLLLAFFTFLIYYVFFFFCLFSLFFNFLLQISIFFL